MSAWTSVPIDFRDIQFRLSIFSSGKCFILMAVVNRSTWATTCFLLPLGDFWKWCLIIQLDETRCSHLTLLQTTAFMLEGGWWQWFCILGVKLEAWLLFLASCYPQKPNRFTHTGAPHKGNVLIYRVGWCTRKTANFMVIIIDIYGKTAICRILIGCSSILTIPLILMQQHLQSRSRLSGAGEKTSWLKSLITLLECFLSVLWLYWLYLSDTALTLSKYNEFNFIKHLYRSDPDVSDVFSLILNFGFVFLTNTDFLKYVWEDGEK